MTKVTCELRALEPGPESAGADGGPAGAASVKGLEEVVLICCHPQ